MFAAIAKLISSRREEAAIRSSASLAFEAKYPEREILKNWRMKPQRDKEGKVVVCVVWNSNTRPPHRTWWLKKEAAFEEISGEEAATLVDVGRYL